MSYIIGNQEQRKSKIDTEKWKEHAAYYSNPRAQEVEETEIPTEVQAPIQPQNLENILQYSSSGKLKLNLEIMYETVINVKVQEEYDVLMKVFEAGGWMLYAGILPTFVNHWKEHGEQTCVSAGWQGMKNRKVEIANINNYKNKKIIGTCKFYEMQGITTPMLEELNEWYDINKPSRASKG